MIKKLLIIIGIIIVAAFIYSIVFAPVEKEIENVSAEETTCLGSGGMVETSLCCLSSGDFPNSCRIGACGCSPDNSHEVKVCNCGSDKCFDGTACASF